MTYIGATSTDVAQSNKEGKMILMSQNRLRKALGVASMTLVVVGGSLVSVSAANAFDSNTYPGVTAGAGAPHYTVTVECDVPGFWEEGEGINFQMAPGGSITVTTQDCSPADGMDIDERSNGLSGGVVQVNGVTQPLGFLNQIPESFVMFANTEVEFRFEDEQATFYLRAEVTADPVADPDGQLGQTTEMIVPAEDPLSTTFPNPLDPGNPDNGCNFSNDGEEHVYQTYDFDVSASGEYTFRFVETNPLDGEVFWWGVDSFFMDDPFLAVYSSFNPANPAENVIGCNDDSGNGGITSTGYFIQSVYPEFSATLTPGRYTLLLTTFGNSPESDWNQGAQGGTFELWGPPGSFSPAQLPATGTSDDKAAVIILVGSITLVLGGLGLIIRRRLIRD